MNVVIVPFQHIRVLAKVVSDGTYRIGTAISVKQKKNQNIYLFMMDMNYA